MTTVTEMLIPVGDDCWFVEASSLGFPPGVWPQTIPTVLGNRRPFELLAPDSEGGRTYRQFGTGYYLTVAND